MANKELFDRLRNLALPYGSYAVFGSGPLGIRGIHECHDLDVIVTQAIYDRYRNGPGWTEGTVAGGDAYLHDGAGIELYTDWAPGTWDVPALIREAELIDGLPFVRLERVIAWKRSSGRAKDIEHLKKYENSRDRDLVR